MRMKKQLRHAAALFMLAASLAGCAGAPGTAQTLKTARESGTAQTPETAGTAKTEQAAEEKQEEQAGWLAYAAEPITLDWYVNYSWFTTPWGENAVSRKITEETGVNIRFLTPMGNASDKFDALIASDSLPDLITLGWWEPQLDEMINQDMVYALNELAEEYDPYFFRVADEQVMDWYEREDGNLYCYPNSTFTPGDYETHDNIGSNQTFLVRKDIYEAIGSPDMTTPEGFADAVRRAAEAFPQVAGEPLIPVGGEFFSDTGCNSFDQYLQNFLAIPYEKDGKLYDRDTDADYVRWLKMFRQLGEEGYLREDIFIDQRTQMEEKLAQGRYFCMIYQSTDIEKQEKILYAKNPDSVYIAVDGPKNAAGDDPVLPGAGLNGWTVTLISKNCAHPERAIAFLSYLLSERGQKLIYLGIEGVTYDMVDGKPVIREEIEKMLGENRQQYDSLYGADDAFWMLQNLVMQLDWRPKPEEPMGQIVTWSYPYTHYLAQYEINLDSETPAGHAHRDIQLLWGETLPALLLAPTEEEFDRIFAEYVKQREALGFAEVMEAGWQQVTENKKKMGLEQ